MIKQQTPTPASDLIQLRTSWRSCSGEPIPADKLALLEAFTRDKTKGIFGEPLRFELVAARTTDSQELKGLGTYGFIRGASAFIVGAVDKRINNLEDYGYLLEEIILFATQLNLATCWLGGTFQKDNFSARINILPHEIVPAVVSVGVGANSRNMVDRLIRNVAGSKKRKPWEDLFFEADCTTPLQRDQAQGLVQVLDMVRLSPSASNKQPWRLVLQGDSVHFFLQRTKGYRKPMFSDLQRIDMGIAMSHFKAMCQELNIEGVWQNQHPPLPSQENWEYIMSWVQ